jgi:hypothetical protein
MYNLKVDAATAQIKDAIEISTGAILIRVRHTFPSLIDSLAYQP